MARIIGVRFRQAGKIYFYSPEELSPKLGDHVIVETRRGVEYGTVAFAPREIPSESLPAIIKNVIRIATPEDDRHYEENQVREKQALEICEEKVKYHKLEMEQRTLDIQPETILLRATWMYDMPKYGVVNRGNFLINMLRQSEISFSFAQHRAVTYVREVAGLIRQSALLPGGAYNYGSENDLTMFETAEWIRQTLSLPVNMRDSGPRHNLWMDCSKIRNRGIHFSDTVEGLQKCIRDYSL